MTRNWKFWTGSEGERLQRMREDSTRKRERAPKKWSSTLVFLFIYLFLNLGLVIYLFFVFAPWSSSQKLGHRAWSCSSLDCASRVDMRACVLCHHAIKRTHTKKPVGRLRKMPSRSSEIHRRDSNALTDKNRIGPEVIRPTWLGLLSLLEQWWRLTHGRNTRYCKIIRAHQQDHHLQLLNNSLRSRVECESKKNGTSMDTSMNSI